MRANVLKTIVSELRKTYLKLISRDIEYSMSCFVREFGAKNNFREKCLKLAKVWHNEAKS